MFLHEGTNPGIEQCFKVDIDTEVEVCFAGTNRNGCQRTGSSGLEVDPVKEPGRGCGALRRSRVIAV